MKLRQGFDSYPTHQIKESEVKYILLVHEEGREINNPVDIRIFTSEEKLFPWIDKAKTEGLHISIYKIGELLLDWSPSISCVCENPEQ